MDGTHQIHYFFSKVGLVPRIIVLIPKGTVIPSEPNV